MTAIGSVTVTHRRKMPQLCDASFTIGVMDDDETGAAAEFEIPTTVQAATPRPSEPLAYSETVELAEPSHHSRLPLVLFVTALLAVIGTGATWLLIRHPGQPAKVPAPKQAVTTAAQPFSRDDVFRGALRRANIKYENFWEAVDGAHDVCTALQSGDTVADLYKKLDASGAFASWKPDDLTHFIVAAQEAYCPQSGE
jgi:hypothetical protein